MGNRNRGSTIIEITLLMPFFLAVIYIYIIFFLFLIETGNYMESMIEYAYKAEMKSDIQNKGCDWSVIQQGNIKIIEMEKEETFFKIQLQLKRNTNNPVEAIRRWQFAASTIY